MLNKNLFNGEFLPYYIQGDASGMFLVKNETGKTILIDVKPNLSCKFPAASKIGKSTETFVFKDNVFFNSPLTASKDIFVSAKTFFSLTSLPIVYKPGNISCTDIL